MFILVAWLQHMQLLFQHSLLTDEWKNCISTSFADNFWPENKWNIWLFLFYLLFIMYIYFIYCYLQNHLKKENIILILISNL